MSKRVERAQSADPDAIKSTSHAQNFSCSEVRHSTLLMPCQRRRQAAACGIMMDWQEFAMQTGSSTWRMAAAGLIRRVDVTSVIAALQEAAPRSDG